jgi:uncharacterized protein with NRDE domain
MNRDEARNRTEANLIKQKTHTKTNAYYPVDKSSGGTWLGFNNYGTCLALLNRYHEAQHDNAISRGLIIPQLLAYDKLTDLEKALQEILKDKHNPFDLVFTDSKQVIKFSWNGHQLNKQKIIPSQPYMLSSSSVTTDKVLSIRAKKFQEYTKQHHQPHAQHILKTLHLQHQPSDASSSIFMSRADTHTKSISQIIINKGTLNYYYFDQLQLQLSPTNYSQCHHKNLKLIS